MKLPVKSVVLSSGHGKIVRGAAGFLDEVDEARLIVNDLAEELRDRGVIVEVFHDNTSTTQDQNLETIVAAHNKHKRDLDISVHLNASDGGGHGVEVLYVTQEDIADQVSAAIAKAGHFTNRGAKYRDNLYVLNNTDAPAIMLEVCFVDNAADVDLYGKHYDEIVEAIADTLSMTHDDEDEDYERPDKPPVERPEGEPIEAGDTGKEVEMIQETLGIPADGDFGPLTDTAVRAFQASCDADDDGVVGAQTKSDLYDLRKRKAAGDSGLTNEDERTILALVRASPLLDYDWKDRGQAPRGYIEGVTLSFALTLITDPLMTKLRKELSVPLGDDDDDALAWYKEQFYDRDISLGTPDDRHRALFVLLIGLGMRESSGQYYCGRDMSAENVESDTAEAGLFQTSWNIASCSPLMDELLLRYDKNPNGWLDVFAQGLTPDSKGLEHYGSGNGASYQFYAKYTPAFAVLTTALGLRKRRQHWGPVNRRDVELRPEADNLFRKIQEL